MPTMFEHIRKAVITLLRADEVEFEPAPLALARGALRRRVDRIEIRASGVPIEHTDVVINQLDVVAEDVRVGMTLRGPSFRVGRAIFTATLTQEQLTALIPLPMGVDRLSVTPRGFTFHTFAGLPIYTVVTLTGHKITVSPTTPAKVPLLDLIGIDIGIPQLPVAGGLEQLTRIGLSFALPELPAGARIEHLGLCDGYVVVSGPLELTPNAPAPPIER